jgi:hypothetical protein
VRAEARGPDFHAALDAAVAKLEAQLRRNHDRGGDTTTDTSSRPPRRRRPCRRPRREARRSEATGIGRHSTWFPCPP